MLMASQISPYRGNRSKQNTHHSLLSAYSCIVSFGPQPPGKRKGLSTNFLSCSNRKGVLKDSSRLRHKENDQSTPSNQNCNRVLYQQREKFNQSKRKEFNQSGNNRNRKRLNFRTSLRLTPQKNFPPAQSSRRRLPVNNQLSMSISSAQESISDEKMFEGGKE